MVSSAAYFELHDWLDQNDNLEPHHFFERMQQAYGLSHLLYFDGAILDSRITIHSLNYTLAPPFNGLSVPLVRQLVLPPLTKALTAIEPFDIRDLSPASAASRSIHKLATNLGIKPVAACYPLLSRNGRAAFLVIQADMREADWRQLRRQHDRDIGALAMRFHAKLLAGKTPEDGIRHTIDRLTRREIETLSWIAAGKSYWEIAVILGITERTVRFFMSNARRKLNVVTNAQAVAEALWHDLIIHPHETHARI